MLKFDIDSMYEGEQRISKGFTCPHCNAFAAHSFKVEDINTGADETSVGIVVYNVLIVSTCQSCNINSLWIKQGISSYLPSFYKSNINKDDKEFEKLIFPGRMTDVPTPNKDMPEDVFKIYAEACLVLQHSPRSSIALSRLAIEQLVDYLEANGKNLNEKIGDLVSKGLPVTIQQMLDSVRVIGNNAVHPGQIEIEGNTDLAISLLTFINLIVDNQISQPKAIQSTYNLIPDSYKKSIEQRDNK